MMNTSILSNMEGVLSRTEMKSIIAGDNSSTNCVICWGGPEEPNHFYHDFNGEDPSQVCRRAGPYSSGSWGECPDPTEPEYN